MIFYSSFFKLVRNLTNILLINNSTIDYFKSILKQFTNQSIY